MSIFNKFNSISILFLTFCFLSGLPNIAFAVDIVAVGFEEADSPIHDLPHSIGLYPGTKGIVHSVQNNANEIITQNGVGTLWLGHNSRGQPVSYVMTVKHGAIQSFFDYPDKTDLFFSVKKTYTTKTGKNLNIQIHYKFKKGSASSTMNSPADIGYLPMQTSHFEEIQFVYIPSQLQAPSSLSSEESATQLPVISENESQ